MRLAFLIATSLALAGCAVPSNTDSWVEGNVSSADAQVLADAVVRVAKQRLPPASTTLVLAPAGTTSSPLPEVIAEGLRKAGFALASAPQTDKIHPLRYMVTPFDGRMLLRVTVDTMTTAQVFAPDGKGQLAPASPQSTQTVAR
ncbi:MAG: hypothetical protein ACM31D_10255 [Bacteroidota bacterium]